MSGITSNTLGRLCAGIPEGVGRYFDIHCPDSAPFVDTATGYVGISTSTPNAALDVHGTISATAYVGDGSGLTGIGQGDRITSGTSHVIVSDSAAVTVRTGGSDRMTVTSAGNVGIGTAAPSNTLHVYGTAKLSGNATTSVDWGSASGKMLERFAGSGPHGIYTSGYSSALTIDASNLQLNAYSSGNVGIGTTTPAATLQVSGSLIVSTSAQTTTPSLYVGTNGNVGIGTSAPAMPLHVNGSIRMGTTAGLSTQGGSLYLQAWNGTTALYNGGGNHTFQVYGAASNVTPNINLAGTLGATSYIASGNVGIGTTSPAKTLDVSGTARITSHTEVVGTVSATQIKIASANEACTAEKIGTLRYDAATGRLEMCRW